MINFRSDPQPSAISWVTMHSPHVYDEVLLSTQIQLLALYKNDSILLSVKYMQQIAAFTNSHQRRKTTLLHHCSCGNQPFKESCSALIMSIREFSRECILNPSKDRVLSCWKRGRQQLASSLLGVKIPSCQCCEHCDIVCHDAYN